jgi:GNAT superfamily N-acetyltransferase
MPGVPPLAHADDDVRCWFRDVVIPDRETWLAEWRGELIAVMVLHADQLDQLYVHPGWTARGVGSELLRLAQRERPDGLWLWTFQSNRVPNAFTSGTVSSRWNEVTALATRSGDLTSGTSGHHDEPDASGTDPLSLR